VVFVPAGMTAVRDASVLSLVAALLEDGTVDTFTATPEYRGDSVVPSALAKATHAERGGGVQPRLEIW